MALIDGTKISLQILTDLKLIIDKYNLDLKLTVILIGNNSASLSYVKMKASDAKDIGINVEIIHKDEDVQEHEIVEIIKKNNIDPSVNGILLQLPIPTHLNSTYLLNLIDPLKDVDGLSHVNIGKLYSQYKGLKPCTPSGCLFLLKKYSIPLAGKKAVVIGRSNLVGRPMAALLEQEDATVTICHSKTKNLKEICLEADIIIAAAGSPYLIKDDMVTVDATVIDVGINFINGKLLGDVDFNKVQPIVKYISPVPGGVGPMTRAMLMKNIIHAYSLQNNPKILRENIFKNAND